ncbi:peptide ABC transporter substrate-binding protein [Entomospira entomophila]|nr:peptide ABC transporter substrate-binding protein [Entomospira entomophilus]WDI35612.1 peptide ABC transporter substrate-binding protein [Entomospira entomophilus]
MASCGVKSEGNRDYFHLNYPTHLGTTHPIFATDLTAYNFLHNIHEGLTTYDEQGNIILGLLEDVQVSSSGLVYKLTLRPNLTFSDGKSLTMHDVYASWRYALHQYTKAPFGYLFDIIMGAAAYRRGESDLIEGISILSETEMEVTLENPFFFFLERLANPTFAILSTDWHDGHEHWHSTSGLYCIHERERDGTLWLEINPYHYAYDSEKIQRVKVSFIGNGDLVYQLFRHRELDWQIKNIPLSLVRQTEDYRFLQESLPNGSYFILFNHRREAYQDVRVRKALSILIDREELASLLEEKPLPNSYLTPFYPDRKGITPHVQEAYTLLTEAGYTEKSPLIIEYKYSTTMIDRMMMSYLVESWQKVGVVQVKPMLIEPAVYRGLWSSGDFDLIRVSWFVSDYEDAEDFLQNFTAQSDFMNSGYQNIFVESMLEQADQAENLSDRKDILLELEHYLMLQDYASIALFSPKNYHLFNDNQWQGFSNSRRDIHALRWIRSRVDESGE